MPVICLIRLAKVWRPLEVQSPQKRQLEVQRPLGRQPAVWPGQARQVWIHGWSQCCWSRCPGCLAEGLSIGMENVCGSEGWGRVCRASCW